MHHCSFHQSYIHNINIYEYISINQCNASLFLSSVIYIHNINMYEYISINQYNASILWKIMHKKSELTCFLNQASKRWRFKTPLTLLDHHSNILPRGLRGTHSVRNNHINQKYSCMRADVSRGLSDGFIGKI